MAGYVKEPDLPVADAIAASAGFPGLIGPYKLLTSNYQWYSDRQCRNKRRAKQSAYYLWDGGVYDNLGLESVYKSSKGLAENVDYLVISNASGSIGIKKRAVLFPPTNAIRLLNIAMDQVYSLRSREVFGKIVIPGKGQYINIGNTAAHIAEIGKVPDEVKHALISECINEADAERVKNYATTLNTPQADDYALILRHGYENAKCVFRCFSQINEF